MWPDNDRGLVLTEPNVALTDFALAIECFAITWLLWSRRPVSDTVQRLFAALFFTIGAGAVFGGITHGFLTSEEAVGSRAIWTATLLSLGLTAMVSWIIGARLLVPQPWWQAANFAAGVLFGLYALAVLFVTQAFEVAILDLLPALLLLLFGYVAAYRRNSEILVLMGISGILLVFVATGLQQFRVAIHPVYFTHNAVYHVLQGVALLLIFKSVPSVSNLDKAKSGK